MVDGFRTEDTILVIGQTGENLIRTAVHQSDKGNPFLLVVLESHHVGFKLVRSLYYVGMDFAGGLLRLCFFLFLD